MHPIKLHNVINNAFSCITPDTAHQQPGCACITSWENTHIIFVIIIHSYNQIIHYPCIISVW